MRAGRLLSCQSSDLVARLYRDALTDLTLIRHCVVSGRVEVILRTVAGVV